MKKNTDKQRLDWLQKYCGNVSATCASDRTNKSFNVCAYIDSEWTKDHKSVRSAIDEAMKGIRRNEK